MSERNWVNLASLTNYQVAPDGSSVLLNALDADGREISLVVPMDPLQQLAFTMPKMVRQSLHAAGVDEASARLTHPVEHWRLEGSKEPGRAILTLCTPDHFEVSYALEDRTLAQLVELIAEFRDESAPMAAHFH